MSHKGVVFFLSFDENASTSRFKFIVRKSYERKINYYFIKINYSRRKI